MTCWDFHSYTLPVYPNLKKKNYFEVYVICNPYYFSPLSSLTEVCLYYMNIFNMTVGIIQQLFRLSIIKYNNC